MCSDTVKYITMSDRIQVILKSNASTGYVWKLTSTDCFELIGTAPAKPYNPQAMSIGSPIDMIYTVKPKHSGEFLLRFEKRRPWEKNTDPVEVYEEFIMVAD